MSVLEDARVGILEEELVQHSKGTVRCPLLYFSIVVVVLCCDPVDKEAIVYTKLRLARPDVV